MQINMFINGLRPHTRQLLDAFVGGKIKLETPEVAMKLIRNMVASDEAIHRDRTFIPAKKNLLELTADDAILVQNKLIAKQIKALTDKLNNLPQQLHALQPTQPSNIQVGGCTLCGGAHEVGLCMIQDEANKELNYMASVPICQSNIKMIRPIVESTRTLIMLRVCIYQILSNKMTKGGYISESKCRNVNFNNDKGHKNRARCKRQEKQTLGCGR